MILAYVLPGVLAALALAMLLAAWRLMKGPQVHDRILALDTLYINALAMVVVFGIWSDSRHFIEVAMLIGLLGFAGTVALAKFVTRGDLVE
jgi:multicomponent K+:H+ antiporter subunit F